MMFQFFALIVLGAFATGAHAFDDTFTELDDGAFGLHDAAKARGKYFGTAIHNDYFHRNVTYYEYVNNTHEFGQLVPENAMKWDHVQPQQGVFTFGKGDEIANIATANKQLLRCHANIWHISTPGWVAKGNFDNATLVAIMKEHIHKEVSHFKGRCYSWDVVNEAVVENGSYRSSVFYETIGPAYIPIAFAAAAEADPDAKLYYNDFAIEVPGPKALATQDIIRMIRSYGVKVDGIGLQGHVDLSGMPPEAHFELGSYPTYDDWVAVMKNYTALVDEVAISELDVSVLTPVTPQNASIYDKQAEAYYNATAACLTFEKCLGVTVWGWSDKYSWVPSSFPDMGDALPWDRDFKKKPAYYGIMKAFREFYI